MSYIVLRSRWFNIVLNAHAPSEEESVDSIDSFYEQLQQVFYHLPKQHMKILLGDFYAKLGIKNISNPAIGNDCLHQDTNYISVRMLNFAI
jgi:hypothetical protein